MAGSKHHDYKPFLALILGGECLYCGKIFFGDKISQEKNVVKSALTSICVVPSLSRGVLTGSPFIQHVVLRYFERI